MIRTIPSKAKKGHFYLFPSLPFFYRTLLIALLFLIGFAFQLFHFLAGFPLILCGILVSLVNSVDNIPETRQMAENKWEKVTAAELLRIKGHYTKTRKWANSFFNLSSLMGALLFIGLILPGLFIWFFLWKNNNLSLVKIWVLDYGAFIFIFSFTGAWKVYKPQDLILKVQILVRALEEIQKEPNQEIICEPMLEMERINQESSLPGDARLVLKFPKAPEDFMSLQIQISINVVGSAHYPYLYIVMVAKKGFNFQKRLKGPAASAFAQPLKKRYTLESTSKDEADILVFRQTTTTTSGYHTNGKQRREIIQNSLALARAIFADFAHEKPSS